ncbi:MULTISPECIES: HEPN domain-containing protein [Caulobacter]|uniref:Uncharacterized protein n=1 Tax=Caulobacter vibrioides OR37 TaxID=1292034 RepID=R0EP73_CAUVI|nr:MULTISPECIES: HEPN domain-containing protein [Caulobacter]ENZ82857.1 hypothetical protein OR37_01051 [Caulobacter vibrioides OR37]
MTDSKVAEGLRPSNRVQRVLISSTSWFIGEFAGDDLLITHAWPSLGNRAARQRMLADRNARGAFVAAFLTDDYEKAPGVVVPQYAGYGEMFAAGMSVLFGKRFDAHGSLQNDGIFNLPDLSAFSTFTDPELPQNNHRPRKTLPVLLNLEEVTRLYPVWTGTRDIPALHAFDAACRFYMRALQSSEHDPEQAYLHLITAGEIISEAQYPAGGRLLDPDLEDLLQRIEKDLPDGKAAGSALRKRLFEIKRRFVTTFMDYIDQPFFEGGEAEAAFWCFQPDRFKASIGAAYDLRSRFVHTGQSFAGWVEPSHRLNDVQGGQPIVNDKDLRKILERAPTLLGLERATRYLILRFGQARLGLDLTPPPPPETTA